MNKAIFVLITILTINTRLVYGQYSVPQLQAGTFINDTIVVQGYQFAGYCDSLGIPDVTISFDAGIIPIATGVELKYIVSACPAPPDTAYCIQTGVVQPGDTFSFPTASSNYTFYSTPYAGGLALTLIIIGTPTVPFEIYPCSLLTVITLADCGNSMLTLDAGIPCSVNNFIGMGELSSGNEIIISPNPASVDFNIEFGTTIQRGSIAILNSIGENIFETSIIGESNKIFSNENISQGIFLIRVFDGKNYYFKKLIIE